MVQTICHELNQPLQVLCGYIDLLSLDDSADETRKEYLRIMAEQVKRMAAVMQALRQMVRDRALARGTAEKRVRVPQPC